MYLSVLVPSSYRSFFARFVDVNLSAVEDWNLVLYQEDATNLDFVQRQDYYEVDQIRSLIFMNYICASPRDFPETMRQYNYMDMIGSGYDLWSFDLNLYRLLDDLEDVLAMLGALGCFSALHSFRLGNPDSNIRVVLN